MNDTEISTAPDTFPEAMRARLLRGLDDPLQPPDDGVTYSSPSAVAPPYDPSFGYTLDLLPGWGGGSVSQHDGRFHVALRTPTADVETQVGAGATLLARLPLLGPLPTVVSPVLHSRLTYAADFVTVLRPYVSVRVHVFDPSGAYLGLATYASATAIIPDDPPHPTSGHIDEHEVDGYPLLGNLPHPFQPDPGLIYVVELGLSAALQGHDAYIVWDAQCFLVSLQSG